MKLKFKKATGLAAAMLASAMIAAPAASADVISTTVTGGNLSFASSGNLALTDVTLNGVNQSVTGTSGTWTVIDARGTGAEWTLAITASIPTTAAGSIETTARTLPVSGLTVTTGTVTAGTGSDAVTSGLTGSTNLALSTSPLTLLASAGTHKGTYTLAPTWALAIPANAYRSNYSDAIGSTPLNPYTSTVTYTLT